MDFAFRMGASVLGSLIGAAPATIIGLSLLAITRVKAVKDLYDVAKGLAETQRLADPTITIRKMLKRDAKALTHGAKGFFRNPVAYFRRKKSEKPEGEPNSVLIILGAIPPLVFDFISTGLSAAFGTIAALATQAIDTALHAGSLVILYSSIKRINTQLREINEKYQYKITNYVNETFRHQAIKSKKAKSILAGSLRPKRTLHTPATAIRRFLIDDKYIQYIKEHSLTSENWEQFYWKFPDDKNDTEVSIRRCDDIYMIVTKIGGKQTGNESIMNSTRETFSVDITREKYDELILLLMGDQDNPIYKHTRHTITDDRGKPVFVDIYENYEHIGLNIARVKFDSSEDAIEYRVPNWFGEDITNNPDYTGQHYPQIKQPHTMNEIPAEHNITNEEIPAMQNIVKIVVTGGPCGGKSTGLSRIEKHFSGLGYYVMFVNETATEMIIGGAVPWEGKNVDFQNALLSIQRQKERVYTEWAGKLDKEKVLIVCDRGALDNKAYMTENDFAAVLSALKTNEIELRDNYDAVFHLVTAANGAVEAYIKNKESNPARTETPEKACELDEKLIAAWTGHPHLRVIDNSTEFKTKIERLISEIAGFLGAPEPFEIERKFLIEYPDLTAFDIMPNCSKVEIIQTYLRTANPDEEIRVRQRGKNGSYIFTETIKRRISDIRRIETERRLTQAEYLNLLLNADTTLNQIRKTRYCLSYANQYLEIDIYPFWDKCAILEVELSDEDQQIIFPDFIKVIREVTNDLSYMNRAIAESIPSQDEGLLCQ
jgi:CYTH domain-containing protein/thymidylate kinase